MTSPSKEHDIWKNKFKPKKGVRYTATEGLQKMVDEYDLASAGKVRSSQGKGRKR